MAVRVLNFESPLYSFGVVVWEIYTGRLPWQGMPPAEVIIRCSHPRLFF